MSVQIQELTVALRLGEEVDTLQSELMAKDEDSPERDAKCQAFVSGVRRLEQSVKDAELALRALTKRRALNQLQQAQKELEVLQRDNRAAGSPSDGATEALQAALKSCAEAGQAQQQLSADPRSKAAAAAFVKSSAYTMELVARVKEALESRCVHDAIMPWCGPK